MKTIRYPEKELWPQLLARPVFETQSLDERVKGVLDEVKAKGDVALKEFTLKFDGVQVDQLQVGDEEIQQASRQISPQLKDAITLAIDTITRFHEAQKHQTVVVETAPGVTCWQKAVPIDTVGLYIPGGTAPLFSTVLMLAIPARIAGCKEVVLSSPPGKDGALHPAIVYAAQAAGVNKIFKVGGAQAIAAMAFGTASIPKVNKIFGPGNQYVIV